MNLFLLNGRSRDLRGVPQFSGAEARQAYTVALGIGIDKVDGENAVIIRVVVAIEGKVDGDAAAASAAVIDEGVEHGDDLISG